MAGTGCDFSGFLAHGVLELKDASDDSAIDAQGGSVDAGGEWADYEGHEVRALLGVAQSLENGCGPVFETNSRPASSGGRSGYIFWTNCATPWERSRASRR